MPCLNVSLYPPGHQPNNACESHGIGDILSINLKFLAGLRAGRTVRRGANPAPVTALCSYISGIY
ncbi:MAG: hypothetical protein B7Z75_07245 [Acidocella sp. 20-57-95]|nr:MAG: hypothetical protein B7Z75_07245 [Acidocella sp. 20-57-95]OYV62642.1 MAG: hypothetical protein B7Z71_00400 [Acidocella sp. 21-58-7]